MLNMLIHWAIRAILQKLRHSPHLQSGTVVLGGFYPSGQNLKVVDLEQKMGNEQKCLTTLKIHDDPNLPAVTILGFIVIPTVVIRMIRVVTIQKYQFIYIYIYIYNSSKW